MNTAVLNEVLGIVTPHLENPFPSTLNGWVEQAHRHSVAWVCRHGLVKTERVARFEACRFAWLVARAYPTAPREELNILADWNVWLFIHDDDCDEAGLGRQPDELARLHDRMRAILAGDEPRAGDGVFEHALFDVTARMFGRATELWRERFVRSVDEYFKACVWEAKNRRDGRIPGIESYVDKRLSTGALVSDIELIEPCEHVYLPLEVRAHPDVRRLTVIANNVVCWCNDIISLPKELERGDVHNLVIAIKEECKLDWQSAANLAAAWHNAEVRRFAELEERLPTFDPEVDLELARYLCILKAWMRGNLDWALQTGRYCVPTLPPTTYIRPVQPPEEGWR